VILPATRASRELVAVAVAFWEGGGVEFEGGLVDVVKMRMLPGWRGG
jgi:hypothetical protein